MAYKLLNTLPNVCEGKYAPTGVSFSQPFVAIIDSTATPDDADDPYQYAISTADTQHVIFPIAGHQWIDAFHYCNTTPTTQHPVVRAFGYFPYVNAAARLAPSDINSAFDAPTEATQYLGTSPQAIGTPGVWLPLYDSAGNHALTINTSRVVKDSTAGGAAAFTILSANNNWYTRGARFGILLLDTEATGTLTDGCILAHLTT